MEVKKTETFKKKRETHEVSQAVKDNLKEYNSIKKKILEAFGNEELNVPQVADKIGMSKDKANYYVMTLLKFNLLQVVGMDDNDEFYFYKKTSK